jgi:hypothetical protein
MVSNQPQVLLDSLRACSGTLCNELCRLYMRLIGKVISQPCPPSISHECTLPICKSPLWHWQAYLRSEYNHPLDDARAEAGIYFGDSVLEALAAPGLNGQQHGQARRPGQRAECSGQARRSGQHADGSGQVGRPRQRVEDSGTRESASQGARGHAEGRRRVSKSGVPVDVPDVSEQGLYASDPVLSFCLFMRPYKAHHF